MEVISLAVFPLKIYLRMFSASTLAATNMFTAMDGTLAPIHYALVSSLLRSGCVDVNACDHHGNTALHVFCLWWDMHSVLMLRCNMCDLACRAARHDVCHQSILVLLELLMDNGADVSIVNAGGQKAVDCIPPRTFAEFLRVHRCDTWAKELLLSLAK